MADIPSVAEIAKLTGLLAPGVVILGVRSRFRDASPPSLSEKTISYALVSVAYGAAAYPIFHAEGWVRLSPWLWQLILSFGFPLLISIVFVFFDQSERFYKVAERLGLKPVHHIPTAWDYTFPKTTATYILVHLSNGSEVAGVWEQGSFASSTTGERDLFIARLYRICEDGAWSAVDPPRSMLICGADIRMVEFIKGTRDE